MQQAEQTLCERCGQTVEPDRLICPRCGGLVHERTLNDLAAQALEIERTNPADAEAVWRRTLDLLPAQSPQHEQIRHRIAALAAGWTPAPQASPGAPQASIGRVPFGAREIPTGNYRAGSRAVRPPDPPAVAIAKTLGSMLIAAVVYYYYPFQHHIVIAVGFVILMLVHEMGHVIAMRWYGLSASPPIFIPFIGALINLRQSPPNALVESIVGIGGPVLGTVGAIVCWGIALTVANPDLRDDLLMVALLGFFLNLFNLLPVPPLDGGRVTAAISPWLWIPGLIALGLMMLADLRQGGSGIIILALILIYALPRIRATLRAQGMKIPYYDVSRTASWTMAALYLGLGVLLVGMLRHLGGLGMLFGS